MLSAALKWLLRLKLWLDSVEDSNVCTHIHTHSKTGTHRAKRIITAAFHTYRRPQKSPERQDNILMLRCNVQ